MALSERIVRPVVRDEEERCRELVGCHPCLGRRRKIGETVWSVATCRRECVTLAAFSAAVPKCSVRDRWIGWDFRSRYGRLNLIANNSRCLILPAGHCRIGADGLARFGYSRIRTGFGPENVTRLRRFAVGLCTSSLKKGENVAAKARALASNTCLVLEDLRMTENSRRTAQATA
ncbi:MAG: DUF4338 domain-containing protein [Betaproteobacteria bacterium]|nr:DUF4338 domain-containing protein [Betaproteobacteria bacterium]